MGQRLLPPSCWAVCRAQLLEGGWNTGGEVQREEAVCDLTGVISWAAVWADTVLLPHCQAELLWGLVGDTGETGDWIYCQLLCIP